MGCGSMRIAVISDIHSNIVALEKVIDEIEEMDVNHTVCTGDLVGYGPRPNEVIDLLHKMEIPMVLGNYDNGVGFERDNCGCAYVTQEEIRDGRISLEWTKKKVTSRNKAILRSLPQSISEDHNGLRLLFVHGSPRRINEYLSEDRPERSLRRMLAPLNIDALVFGHTHIPYHRIVDDIHMINAGSVGKPKDGDPRACLAILDISEEIQVSFQRVNYDVDSVVNEICEEGLPDAFAQALLTGRG